MTFELLVSVSLHFCIDFAVILFIGYCIGLLICKWISLTAPGHPVQPTCRVSDIVKLYLICLAFYVELYIAVRKFFMVTYLFFSCGHATL